jgi:hypothetical protein
MLTALDKLEETLNATNVLSDDYRRHVLGLAHLAASQAYDKGRADTLEKITRETT